MKKIGLAMCIALCFSACSDGGEKKAQQFLKQAEQSLAAAQFSEAKLQIDSIRILYPKAFEARKKGIKLMQQIDLKEQQRNVAYLDSMLALKQEMLDKLKEHFVLEKDTAYQEIGNYFYPTQVVEKNIGRSFLRAQVNELGEMSMTSIYCGGRSLHHTVVKVSAGDVFAETPSSKDMYETKDLGRPIEKADYKLGEDGGVISFIHANKDKQIKVKFIGDKYYVTQMHPNDRKAFAEVVELASVLSSMEQMRKEKKEANLKIQFVTRKMNESKQEQDKEAK